MSGTDSLSEKQSYIIKQKQLKQQFTFIPQVKYKSEMQKIINLSPEISFKQKYELMLENQKQQRLIRLQQLQKTIQQTQYQLQQGGLQLSGTKLDQQIEQHELVQQDRDQLLQRITMSQYKVEQLKRDEIEQIRQQFYQNLYDEKETSYINLNNNKKLQ
ncbi:hypothetical protein SS50377_21135 [Spironucleus salmonicida]|uniref:Uncharacterized protein n=1 Tax=Spironucleus salmonicida TaxID=348837 RepID=V6LH97_9EUKA|nr:hypothetical protein SS50377_21135 [Spironucleus salmonicida]|eukprot:EST43917.1 Hypothetical protein SS50377_16219 [Spironucleus salmonicida]